MKQQFVNAKFIGLVSTESRYYFDREEIDYRDQYQLHIQGSNSIIRDVDFSNYVNNSSILYIVPTDPNGSEIDVLFENCRFTSFVSTLNPDEFKSITFKNCLFESSDFYIDVDNIDDDSWETESEYDPSNITMTNSGVIKFDIGCKHTKFQNCTFKVKDGAIDFFGPSFSKDSVTEISNCNFEFDISKQLGLYHWRRGLIRETSKRTIIVNSYFKVKYPYHSLFIIDEPRFELVLSDTVFEFYTRKSVKLPYSEYILVDTYYNYIGSAKVDNTIIRVISNNGKVLEEREVTEKELVSSSEKSSTKIKSC